MTKDLLSDEARKIYNSVRRKMKTAEIYDKVDEPLIIAYAHSLNCYREVSEQIENDGYTCSNGKGGIVKHPLLSSQKAYLEQLTACARQLKITPFERMKGKATKSAKTRKIDPLAKLRKVN